MAQLSAIGNCNVCHTAADGKPFAGGRPLKTPFGTIHGTNITPDAETGIGRWSEAAFRRALHKGLDRSGRHLYPAFPYDHFTKLTDSDVGALYAFMMTRDPVTTQTPPNRRAQSPSASSASVSCISSCSQWTAPSARATPSSQSRIAARIRAAPQPADAQADRNTLT